MSESFVVGEWERIHHRLGMAGEGQADIIEQNIQGRVLYVGCGSIGDFGDCKIKNVAALAEQLRVIDVIPQLIKTAKTIYSGLLNVDFEVEDARSLSSFGDESFDSILALGLFAHISLEDTPKVFAEFWRVCRPGGTVMVTNSTRHFIDVYIDAAVVYGFELRIEKEGDCQVSSTGRRYLLGFGKPNKHLATRSSQKENALAN